LRCLAAVRGGWHKSPERARSRVDPEQYEIGAAVLGSASSHHLRVRSCGHDDRPGFEEVWSEARPGAGCSGQGARLPIRYPGIGLLPPWRVSLAVLSRPHPIETFPFLAIYDPGASRRNGAGAVSSPAAFLRPHSSRRFASRNSPFAILHCVPALHANRHLGAAAVCAVLSLRPRKGPRRSRVSETKTKPGDTHHDDDRNPQ